jgi:hypothetical protein
VIAVACDGRRLGAGKMTLKASLSSTRFFWSDPYRPPHRPLHAADRGARNLLEFCKLESAIMEYIENHNGDPKPFIWTKSAGEILEKVARAKQSQH